MSQHRAQSTHRVGFRITVLGLAFVGATLLGTRCPGLDLFALVDLHHAGVDKYVGQFAPVSEEPAGDDWTKHTFDPDDGDGPICIAGTPFTAFTRDRDPHKLLIFLNGGGACWQNFYFCSITATDTLPPVAPGIFSDSFDTGSGVIENPFADYSMMFVSYCDGSVFSGDNDVDDPSFPAGPVRHHRGLRNLSAALDLAHEEFPHARTVVVSGSSAGGVGAVGFAPFVARFVFGNFVTLRVFNDAGPVAVNLNETAAIQARAQDWQFGQFYPSSCDDCSVDGQPTAIIDWMLKRDSTVTEAFYETDGDSTNRFFLNVPTAAAYRQLLLDVHGPLHDAWPTRYKRYIRANQTSHTSFGSDLFYTATANGVPLYQWVYDFVRNRSGWVDIVESP